MPGQDTGTAQLLSHFEASSNIPTMSLKIEKKAIEAGTRRLATSWSMELEQDIMNMNGIDIDSEMTNAMSYEIQSEIDREMVVRMIQVALNAGLGTGYSVWKPSLADGRWFAERGVDFYARIVVEANRICIRNRRGPANFIIATPKVVTILQLLPEFRPFEIASNIQVHPNGVAVLELLLVNSQFFVTQEQKRNILLVFVLTLWNMHYLDIKVPSFGILVSSIVLIFLFLSKEQWDPMTLLHAWE